MKITCPQCHFEREVPRDRLPGKTAIATCPHCHHRFRIICDEFRSPDSGLTPERIAAQLSPLRTPSAPSSLQADATAPSAGHSAPSTLSTAVPDTPPTTPQATTPEQPQPHKTPRAAAHEDDDNQLPPGAIIPRQIPAHDASPSDASRQPPLSTNTDMIASSPQAKTGDTRQGESSPSEEKHAPFATATPQDREEAAQEPILPPLDNPWDHPERESYLAAFYQTSMRVMFAASRFFVCLREESPKTRALSFFLLICVLQVLIERFWGGVLFQVLGADSSTDPQLRQILAMLTPHMSLPMSLLIKSAVSTLALFFLSGVYYAAFRIITPEKANYALIFQILAYSSAPDLLCIIPVVGYVVGFVWSLACSLIGLRYALRVSWVQIAATVLPLYALALMLISFASRSLTQTL